VVRQHSLDRLVADVCDVLDEPIGDTSVFLNHFIFGFVSQSVKVCLSGLGGDELFGGYNRHLAFKFLPAYTAVPRVLRQGFRSIASHLPSSRHGRIGNKVRLLKTFLAQADGDLGRTYCNFVDYMFHCGGNPVPSAGRFTNTRFEASWDERIVDEFNRIYKYDLANYMVNDLLFLTDRMSMRHSIEARVPYLENDLADFALGIPPSQKIRGRTLKYLLKKVAERHLPREVIYRRKQGFSSPIGGLLTPEALDRLAATVRDSRDEYVDLLDRALFGRLIEAHRAGTEDHSLNLFTLIVYLGWMRSVLGRRA
jgi:asparagine synthase (glutamine-hydrolysing)